MNTLQSNIGLRRCSDIQLCLHVSVADEYGWFQVKTDIAFLAFFKILDKDEDNSSLGYHCGVKFQDDKIRHVLNMRVSSNDAEIINKCAKMRVKNNQ